MASDRHHGQRASTSAQRDHLPAAEPARQRRALGVAEAAQQDRRRPSARSPASEPEHARAASAKPATVAPPTQREHPERRLGPLAAAQHAEDRGGQRQQADEHDRVRRGDVLQRQGRQQRKADHHAHRHDRQRRQVAPRRAAPAASASEQRRAEQRPRSPRGRTSGTAARTRPTATRVAGSEPLKMTTPTRPAAPPFRCPLPSGIVALRTARDSRGGWMRRQAQISTISAELYGSQEPTR